VPDQNARTIDLPHQKIDHPHRTIDGLPRTIELESLITRAHRVGAARLMVLMLLIWSGLCDTGAAAIPVSAISAGWI
jgi:hypothetical protein